MPNDPPPHRAIPRRRVTRERLAFERLVRRAIEGLPDDVLETLENIAIVVDDEPSQRQLQGSGLGPGETLYGLYEGIPLTQRGYGYTMVLPDKITIFQGPIERDCRTHGEIKQLVKDVVRHELAHYFGYSDAELSD